MIEYDKYMSIMKRLNAYVKSQMINSDFYNWPKVNEMARRYRCKVSDILDMVYDSENLDLVVGMQIPNGGGHGTFDYVGNYRIEYFE